MKKFEITREQILEMARWGARQDIQKVKQWFPEAFEKPLEVGKWYKNKYNSLFCIEEIKSHNVLGYGFDSQVTRWKDALNWDCSGITEATPQEVENALIQEAIKRGYKAGLFCEFGTIKDVREIKSSICVYNEKSNALIVGDDCIFQDGNWAKLIETITKKEAEKILNKKIV